MTTDPVNVICMKWGDKFGPEYVNSLCAMVKRNLQRPHRFVCLTDRPDGLRNDVEHYPLPEEIDRPENYGLNNTRQWAKLGIFRRNLGDLTGRTLYLDLDVLIVDSIDELFDVEGQFLLGHDYAWYGRRPNMGNGSTFRYEFGAHADILEDFLADRDKVIQTHRSEQRYVSAKIIEAQGKLKYWPEAWCPSFKRHCIPTWPLNYFVPPRLPAGAKIVVFHGNPNPPEALRGESGKWYRYIRPTRWIADHWRE